MFNDNGFALLTGQRWGSMLNQLALSTLLCAFNTTINKNAPSEFCSLIPQNQQLFTTKQASSHSVSVRHKIWFSSLSGGKKEKKLKHILLKNSKVFNFFFALLYVFICSLHVIMHLKLF